MPLEATKEENLIKSKTIVVVQVFGVRKIKHKAKKAIEPDLESIAERR